VIHPAQQDVIWAVTVTIKTKVKIAQEDVMDKVSIALPTLSAVLDTIVNYSIFLLVIGMEHVKNLAEEYAKTVAIPI
jgi:hypothetical protein